MYISASATADLAVPWPLGLAVDQDAEVSFAQSTVAPSDTWHALVNDTATSGHIEVGPLSLYGAFAGGIWAAFVREAASTAWNCVLEFVVEDDTVSDTPIDPSDDIDGGTL